MGSSGNFWGGFLLGRLSKDNKPKEKVGFLWQLFGLIILGAVVVAGMTYGLKGIVIALVISFIGIPILFAVLMSALQKNKTIAEEAFQLFNDKQYTLALEKAERVAMKNYNAASIAGIMYLQGLGCDVDAEKAFSYFKYAQKGDIEAKGLYGYMLIEGIGCTQDLNNGKRALLNAASVGNDKFSTMKIGEYQVNGDFGWKKDVKQGMKNLRIAADAGYAYAKYLVGVIQFEGLDEVPQNRDRGYSLIQEAAELGCSDAIDFLRQAAE